VWEDDNRKRSLGIREKKILYERANHKCESCRKEISFLEMQVGHKKAHSKGGIATLSNTVCICYMCNNLMGTDNWNSFLKKMGKQPQNNGSESKNSLNNLSISQLKFLAKKFGVKAKGKTEEGLFEIRTFAPTKSVYVKLLSKKVSNEKVEKALKEYVKPIKKTKKRSSNSGFLF
jgi:hypothetical protein